MLVVRMALVEVHNHAVVARHTLAVVARQIRTVEVVGVGRVVGSHSSFDSHPPGCSSRYPGRVGVEGILKIILYFI